MVCSSHRPFSTTPVLGALAPLLIQEGWRSERRGGCSVPSPSAEVVVPFNRRLARTSVFMCAPPAEETRTAKAACWLWIPGAWFVFVADRSAPPRRSERHPSSSEEGSFLHLTNDWDRRL